MSRKQNRSRKDTKQQENILSDVGEHPDTVEVAGSSSQHGPDAGFPPQHSMTSSLPTADPVSITLFCFIHGEETPFSVKIQADVSVDALKKNIKEAKQPRLNGLAADELQLWKLNDPIPANQIVNKVSTLGTDLSTLAEQMNPVLDISDYFQPQSLLRKHLHIIVEIPTLVGARSSHSKPNANDQEPPEDADMITPLWRDRVQAATKQLLETWSQPFAAHNLEILRARLQQPLTEEEKIPISRAQFNSLISYFSVEHPDEELQEQDLLTLFRLSREGVANAILLKFMHAIDTNPPASGTEDAFHATWDNNIASIIRLILSTGTSLRNSNQGTSTALKRPDYAFLIDNYCLLRGEEKGTNPEGSPLAELIEKLIWTYDPLRYILGYHAITTKIHFVAITNPPMYTEPLFSHDLKIKKHRVANLIHMIRLAGILVWLRSQLGDRRLAEFAIIERPDGFTRIKFGVDIIKKEFTDASADAKLRIENLVSIYKLLKEKQVPNVDTLVDFNANHNPPYVTLSPIGQDKLPERDEALDAIVCVLNALIVMHSPPTPVYHRDIREPNILKRLDGQGWFLIDWTDASATPTIAATHLTEHEHSPRVRQDNHGGEVDVWGVGSYLLALCNRSRVEKPAELISIARKWMDDPTITAEAALAEINAHRHFFYKPEAKASLE